MKTFWPCSWINYIKLEQKKKCENTEICENPDVDICMQCYIGPFKETYSKTKLNE
jgi:hypothetical protein